MKNLIKINDLAEFTGKEIASGTRAEYFFHLLLEEIGFVKTKHAGARASFTIEEDIQPEISTRAKVFEALDGERHYQDTIRKSRENDIDDNTKSPADFIVYMDVLLGQIKLASYNLKTDVVLDLIRKLTAVGVATMENFGIVKR